MNLTDRYFKHSDAYAELNDSYNLNINYKHIILFVLEISSICKNYGEEDMIKYARRCFGKDFEAKIADGLKDDGADANRRLIKLLNESAKYINEDILVANRLLNDNRCNIPLAQISKILDIKENYITRNFMEHFDYFKLPAHARIGLKLMKTDLDIKFLNKHVFVSRQSLHDFLKEHLRYTDKMLAIDLNMDDCFREQLEQKFNTFDKYKAAITKAVKLTNQAALEYCNDKSVSVDNRKNRKQYVLSDVEINKVIAEDYNLQSIATIGADLRFEQELIILEKKKEIEKNNLNEATQQTTAHLTSNLFEYTSVNNAQIYYLLDNIVESSRFVFTGLDSRLGEATIVRYSNVNNNIIDGFLNPEEFKYSLNEKIYNQIVKNEKDEQLINQKIQKFFFDKMMSNDFNVYERQSK